MRDLKKWAILLFYDNIYYFILVLFLWYSRMNKWFVVLYSLKSLVNVASWYMYDKKIEMFEKYFSAILV